MMLLVWLVAIWLTGFGFVRWMFPQPLRRSLHNIFLFSLGIGAGAGIASCLYFLMLVLAGATFSLLPAAGGVALVVALVLFLFARKGALLDWAEGPEVPRYLTVLFVLAAALALIMFLGAVTYNPHGEEGAWSIWNMKARFLFRAGAFWRDAFSSDLGFTHLDYPLLLPGLVALCWKLAGQESTNAPVAVAFLFLLGTTGVLVSALGVLRGKTPALLAGTLLLGTASFIALSAALYSDVPVSFYVLATLALLCLQDRHPDDMRFTGLAGLMAGFAAWSRNEGIIFVLAVLVARAIALIRFGERKLLAPQFLRLLLGLAAPLGVVIFFKLRIGGLGDWMAVPASTILNHLSEPARWIVMLEGLVIILFNFGRFLIPIFLALGLYWYLVRFRTLVGTGTEVGSGMDARDRTGVATAAIALALTLGVQLVADVLYLDNLGLEIGTSFERIMLQLWPGALLAFFLASAPLQLIAPKLPEKGTKEKRAHKGARRVAETR